MFDCVVVVLEEPAPPLSVIVPLKVPQTNPLASAGGVTVYDPEPEYDHPEPLDSVPVPDPEYDQVTPSAPSVSLKLSDRVVSWNPLAVVAPPTEPPAIVQAYVPSVW